MPIRISLLSIAVPCLLAFAPAHADDLDGSPPAVGAAEAERLYTRANDFVTRINEGQYSYAYLQFYWKRAQSNVDRVLQVYADSPTAHTLAAGHAKLGPYSLDYFRDRVLYRLEEKRLGAYDSVNCQIFLYNLDQKRQDAARDLALESIIEVLARQQRWGEVLAFPVLPEQKPLLYRTIFRVAARYDQKSIVEQFSRNIIPGLQKSAKFWPELAEADALLGKPAAEIDAVLKAHPDDEVRLAALHGSVVREITIRRMSQLHAAITNTIAATHFELLNLSHRDDVEALAHKYFPQDVSKAAPLLAVYHAALGRQPSAMASSEAHLAYLRYLADGGQFDRIDRYLAEADLGPEARQDAGRFAVELYAESGRGAEADQHRQALSDGGPAGSDGAALAEFEGFAESIGSQLTVREKTFADLGIHDPCVLAQAIGEWSLSPNRTQRGAFPWDAVVYKYAGGFDNLPPPASKAVKDAASTVKPY